MNTCRWAVAVSLLVTMGAPASAQVNSGEIFGKATDVTGAVLRGVAVTLVSAVLIQPQTVITSAAGGYRVPQIPIGVYTVTFELAGFRTLVREGVVIQAGFNAEIDARLDLSAMQEKVTVTAAPPIVDTRPSTAGSCRMIDAI